MLEVFAIVISLEFENYNKKDIFVIENGAYHTFEKCVDISDRIAVEYENYQSLHDNVTVVIECLNLKPEVK